MSACAFAMGFGEEMSDLMHTSAPSEPSSLWQYLQALDGIDRTLHTWLAETDVLPTVPKDRRTQRPATPEGTSPEEESDEVTELPGFGITAELIAVAQPAEVTLLLLPACWNYLERCPQEWQRPDSERRLARLTGQLLGLRTTPRDAATLATGRAKTIVRILQQRADTTTKRAI